MRGATAPRLLLELICARVLLPGADHSTEGVMARLDRLERRMTISGGDPSPAPIAATEPESVKPAPHVVEPTVIEPVRQPSAEAPPEPAPALEATPEPMPSWRRSHPAPETAATEPETPLAPEPGSTTTTAGSTLTLVDVRRLWPDIVEATKQRRRLTWIYLTQQAQVVAVDDTTLTLGFANAGARDSFDSGGSAEIVRQAAIDVVGHDWRVETIVDPGADPEAATPPPSRPAEPVAQPPGPQPVPPSTPRAVDAGPTASEPPIPDRPASAPSRSRPTAAPAPTTPMTSPPGATAPSCSRRRSVPRSSKRSPTSDTLVTTQR